MHNFLECYATFWEHHATKPLITYHAVLSAQSSNRKQTPKSEGVSECHADIINEKAICLRVLEDYNLQENCGGRDRTFDDVYAS